jgi:hypothetical protein
MTSLESDNRVVASSAIGQLFCVLFGFFEPESCQFAVIIKETTN